LPKGFTFTGCRVGILTEGFRELSVQKAKRNRPATTAKRIKGVARRDLKPGASILTMSAEVFDFDFDFDSITGASSGDWEPSDAAQGRRKRKRYLTPATETVCAAKGKKSSNRGRNVRMR
jgi:hypothetical protein